MYVISIFMMVKLTPSQKTKKYEFHIEEDEVEEAMEEHVSTMAGD